MSTSKKTVKLLVEGGKATPGPPIGPALGPYGVNIAQVVKEINQKTKQFEGMKVPVKVIIDVKTRKWEVEVGTPPTSALILRELGVEKGSGNPKEEKIGNLTFEQVKKIAKVKLGQSYAKTLKSAVLEVLGTCVSMGVTVEGKDPREVQREVKGGAYDNLLTGEA